VDDNGHRRVGGADRSGSASPAFTLTAVIVTCAALALVIIGVGVASSIGAQSPTTVDATVSQWKIAADSTAPAGDVTFRVTNGGSIVHEMLVLKTKTPANKIPITDAGDPPVPVTTGADKIDESSSIGETGEPDLQPGATRTFTLKKLQPGHYVLVCNIADHYANGMRTTLTVTP
jgi:uncharacterized cupredoxin-like copper-binding protein